MEHSLLSNTVIFWILALIPGVLHPLLLYTYFVRYSERRDLIQRLLEHSVHASRTGRQSKAASITQKEQWQGQLDLDKPSYILPILITSVISVAAAVVMLSINLKTNDLQLPADVLTFTRLATPATVAGFAGAYIWGLYDFADRFRILSLPPSALHMIWFRLLLGPVLGAFAQQLLAKDFAPVLVFALASIPVPDLLKWLQDTASQRFSIANQGPVVPPKWELVEGLTPDIVARLKEVGVSSVAHLGNQDPVNLLRRTNIEWLNILDMMDQAYLVSYIDSAIDKLRGRGIRGSIEMAVLWDRLKSEDAQTRAEADAVVHSIAVDLGKDDPSIKNLARNLYEDPQVERIWALWWRPSDVPTSESEDLGDLQSEKSEISVGNNALPISTQRPESASAMTASNRGS